MTRKIIASAVAAIAIGTFAAAPRIAEALGSPFNPTNSGFTVAADVPSSTTASVTTTPTANASWTGSGTAQIPFVITVTSNDGSGYTFGFTGGHANVFTLAGTNSNTTTITYTITDSTPQTYAATGVAGTVFNAAGFATAATATTFNVNLPMQLNVPADNYTDTITAIITPQ